MTRERRYPSKEIKAARTITEAELIESAQSFLEANESAEGKYKLGYISLQPENFGTFSVGESMVSGGFLSAMDDAIKPLYAFFYTEKMGEVFAVRYEMGGKDKFEENKTFLTARCNKYGRTIELRKVLVVGGNGEGTFMSNPVVIASDNFYASQDGKMFRSLMMAKVKPIIG